MGQSDEVTLDDFKEIYGSDTLYHFVGFDNPMLYTAHKVSGAMTSLYRQLGIGCERLVRKVLQDELALTDEQVNWSYEIVNPANPSKKKTLYLDGRIVFSDVEDATKRRRIKQWAAEQATEMGISQDIEGVVFEVRQGYKSADSKRQNGDLQNAKFALESNYLMCVMVLSNQINQTVEARYINAGIPVLRGNDSGDPASDTFAFFKEIIGCDLSSCLKEQSSYMASKVEEVLTSLLDIKADD